LIFPAREHAPMEPEHFHHVQEDLREPYDELRQAIPGVMSAYSALSAAAMADGALPAKTKELIALAIAITRECDGCVAAHARGAARRGASTEEVSEMIGVAISMNGGPGIVWGPRALAAFHEFYGG
jgi:AhpD family alkylhydroperoxidase